ncbi:MAG: energy transducer TonB [Prevotellaceae bacterium]|jgi:TonB family protein|nr:energy transducer TonB [Prevotellaceae bacterium]
MKEKEVLTKKPVKSCKLLFFLALTGIVLMGNTHVVTARSAQLPDVASVQADTTVYITPSDAAQYPGGQAAALKYVADNLQYPAQDKADKKQGTLLMKFVIERDGSVNHITVVRRVGGATPAMEAEAIRLLKNMPKWTPAKDRGAVVRASAGMPIRFKL